MLSERLGTTGDIERRPLAALLMKRFVEGEDRRQSVLLPEYLDDFVGEENQVRVIEAFVEELDLAALGFEGVAPAAKGRLSSERPAEDLRLRLHQPDCFESEA
jgi:hypothetical protein